MINKYFKIISIIIVLFFSCSNSMHKYSKPESFSITFDVNSAEISEEANKLISKFHEMMKENDLIGKKYILIGILPIKSEVDKDKYIGYKRAKNIIDIFVEKYNYQYFDFLIIDSEYCEKHFLKGTSYECKPKITLGLKQR